MSSSDVDRFAELYEAHVDALFAYALGRTSRDRASEVVEETFLVAWRRLAQVPTEPRPWLLGVARRVLANQRRADARRAALGLRAASSGAEHLEPDHAEQVVERDRVLGALARLKEPDRELLCLTAWGELSPEEAAGVLGCTKATLSVRLHRARRRLDAALEAEDRDAKGAEASDSGGPCAPTIARLPTPTKPITPPKEALR